MARQRDADWDARKYHRVSEPQFAWGQAVLARLPLRGDETAIDAGCGTGRLTAELLTRLPRGRVLALDSSARMLEIARENLSPSFGGRICYLRADLSTLELFDFADVIFSTATFHWVADHDRLFRNLYAALKPGGVLHAQCGGGPNLARLHHRAEALMRSERFAPYFESWVDPWSYADEKTTAQRLKAAGFADVATDLEEAPTLMGSGAEYREFVSTVVLRNHLARISEPAHRAEFLDAIEKEASRDQPAFALDYCRLNLRGSRPLHLAGDPRARGLQ